MRTIKFRAKRIDNGEWVYGHYYEFRGEHFITSGEELYTVDESTLGQFTNMTSHSEKEIFDGDVNMNYDGRRSEVVFYAGGFYLKFSKTEYKEIGGFAPFDLTILGNITDNKELLS